MIALCCLTLAATGQAVAPPPSVAALRAELRLPNAVHCQAISINNQDAEPYDLYEVESASDWGRATQSLNKGPAGYVLQSCELWTPALTVSYQVDSLKGVVEHNPLHHRGGGCELFVSPISLLRCMETLTPNEIKWTVDQSLWTADFVTSTGDLKPRHRHWTVAWDGAAQTLSIVSGWSPSSRMSQTFTQWKDLPGGARWPMIDDIVFGPADATPPPLRKRVSCVSVAPITPGPPPQPRLPKGLALLNVKTGEFIDEHFEPVAAGEPGSPANPSAGAEGSASWMGVGGRTAAALLLGAGAGALIYRRLRM